LYNITQNFHISQTIQPFILYYFEYILIHLSVLWDPIVRECYLHCMHLILAWWWSLDRIMSSKK